MNRNIINTSRNLYNKKLLNLLTSLVCIVAINFNSLGQSAPAIAALTTEQYDMAKTLLFKDLEKDTYVKFDNGLIADRYEMKPPYVFNFSDGAERKVYLYKLSLASTKSMLGLLAVYQNVKSGKVINLCMPSNASEKQLWGKYIDDIKEADKAEPGFASCATFTLSKELTALMNPGGESAAAIGDDYEFCFPGGALVTLYTGQKLPIEKLQKGDIVLFYQSENHLMPNKVQKVIEHHGKAYKITKIDLVNASDVTASLDAPTKSIQSLEATPNHPVLTINGIKSVKDLTTEDMLLHYNYTLQRIEYFQITNITSNYRSVGRVYNLKTKHKNYVVNEMVVIKK